MSRITKYEHLYDVMEAKFPNSLNTCFRKDGSIKATADTDIKLYWYILRVSDVHNNKYDYSKVAYINSQDKITVICPTHGDFQIPMCRHLKLGCPRCGKKKIFNTGDFIQAAKTVHGDKYDYSRVEYANTDTPVRIICHLHGEFLQTPHDHVSSKSNCPVCANRSYRFLYLLQGEGSCVKIGVTSSFRRRLLFLNSKYEYPWTPLVLIDTGGNAASLESQLHKRFSDRRAYPSLDKSLPEGYTEIFLLNSKEVEDLIAELLASPSNKEMSANGSEY